MRAPSPGFTLGLLLIASGTPAAAGDGTDPDRKIAHEALRDFKYQPKPAPAAPPTAPVAAKPVEPPLVLPAVHVQAKTENIVRGVDEAIASHGRLDSHPLIRKELTKKMSAEVLVPYDPLIDGPKWRLNILRLRW